MCLHIFAFIRLSWYICLHMFVFMNLTSYICLHTFVFIHLPSCICLHKLAFIHLLSYIRLGAFAVMHLPSYIYLHTFKYIQLHTFALMHLPPYICLNIFGSIHLAWRTMTHSYAWDDSFIHVTDVHIETDFAQTHSYVCGVSIHICAMTHSNVWNRCTSKPTLAKFPDILRGPSGPAASTGIRVSGSVC